MQKLKAFCQKENLLILVAILVVIVIIAIVIVVSLSGGVGGVSAREHLNLGEKYLFELNYSQALVHFLYAIEIEPMNPRGYIGAAEAYLGLGDMEREIISLELGYERTGDDIIKHKLEELKINFERNPPVVITTPVSPTATTLPTTTTTTTITSTTPDTLTTPNENTTPTTTTTTTQTTPSTPPTANTLSTTTTTTTRNATTTTTTRATTTTTRNTPTTTTQPALPGQTTTTTTTRATTTTTTTSPNRPQNLNTAIFADLGLTYGQLKRKYGESYLGSRSGGRSFNGALGNIYYFEGGGEGMLPNDNARCTSILINANSLFLNMNRVMSPSQVSNEYSLFLNGSIFSFDGNYVYMHFTYRYGERDEVRIHIFSWSIGEFVSPTSIVVIGKYLNVEELGI
jgi:tetratricopeptide (TPR) repeat protein